MARKNEKNKRGVEVAPAGELRKKYGLVAANRPRVNLDKRRVPETLWPLIPDAELVGVSDDLIREDVWNNMPEEQRRDVTARVHAAAEELEKWLGGPEAESETPSPEYVAFSALRLTAYLGGL
jgi:hypothetical protein